MQRLNTSRNLRIKEVKKTKSQPAIEYLSTFSTALLLLIIIVSIVGLLLFTSKSSTQAVSSCYISVQLNCVQLSIANNGIQSEAVVVLTNNLNMPITFPHNSFTVKPTGLQNTYFGGCYPANSIVGSTIICNATLAGYSPSIGSMVEPSFALQYSQCSNGTCATYNVSGEATVYVSSTPTIYPVTLLTLPAGGKVSVNGNEYPSNTLLYFVAGKTYSVYPSGPAGFTQFEGWITTANEVSVANSLTAATTASATSGGILEAVFQCFSLTLLDNPASSGIEIPTPSSSGNCPARSGTVDDYLYSYLPGTPVSASQSSAQNYWFSSWSGSSGAAGTSYTGPGLGSSHTANVVLNSDVVQTANYEECYLLTVNKIGSGSTSTPSPSSSTGCNTGYYLPGTQVSITATPTSGWTLGSVTNDWTGSGSGSVNGGSSTITVTMNSAITETANFNPSVTITESGSGGPDGSAWSSWGACVIAAGYPQICAGSGVQTATEVVPYGSTISYICTEGWANGQASGSAGYWMWGSVSTDTGQCTSGLSIPVTSLTTITEYYNAAWCLQPGTSGQGSMSPSGLTCQLLNNNIGFTAYPNAGYQFSPGPGWSTSGGNSCYWWSGYNWLNNPSYISCGGQGTIDVTPQFEAVLACSGISDAFNPITAGGGDQFCVSLSGGSGNYCYNGNYGYGNNIYGLAGWSFPCSDGATSCPAAAGYSCSGNQVCIGVNGNPVTFGNAGTFSGTSEFSDSQGNQCTASGSVQVNPATPSPGCYSSGVHADANGWCVINGVDTGPTGTGQDLCYESDVQNTADCPSWTSGQVLIQCQSNSADAYTTSGSGSNLVCYPDESIET